MCHNIQFNVLVLYSKTKIYIWFTIFMTKNNTIFFWLTKKGEYKYKYIWFKKRVNINTNMFELTKKGKYKYKYKYLGWYSQIRIRIRIFVTTCSVTVWQCDSLRRIIAGAARDQSVLTLTERGEEELNHCWSRGCL